MSNLSLSDFRSDYSRLVVRHGDDKKGLKLAAKKVIEEHYSANSQLRHDCLNWLRGQLK